MSGTLQNNVVGKYSGLPTQNEELETKTLAIDPKTLTLDQKDAVKSFFAKSADLIEQMN